MTTSNILSSAALAHRAAGEAMDRMSDATKRGDYLVAAEEAETAANCEYMALMAYAGYLRSKAQTIEIDHD